MNVNWLFWGILVIGGLRAAWAQPLSPAHPKYKVALAVYADVAATFGGNRPRPELVLLSGKSPKRIIARYVNGRVEMDEYLYDVCRTLGADSLAALACVFGHELTHYYRDHTGSESFSALLNLGTAIGKNKEYEAEADYYGVFHGFMAGFETYAVVARLYERIYDRYQLPENMPGYPTKAERIRIASQKASEIKALAQVLEAGKVLYFKGDYPSAARCFRHLLDQFPAREIYNNLGTAYLAQAAVRFTDQELPFAFPFELDPVNRLLSGQSRGTTDEDQPTRTALLEKAEDCFQKAVDLDNSYTPAYINLAVAQIMLNVPSAAVGTVDVLSKRINGRLPGNAHLVRGIALVKQQRAAEAENDFNQAVRLNAFRADYNRQLYRKLNRSVWDDVVAWMHDYLAPDTKPAKPLPLPKTLQVAQTENSADQWEIAARLTAPDPVYVYQNAANGAHSRIETAAQQVAVVRNATKAVQPWVGRKISEWFAQYREPDAVFTTEQVAYYVYRQSRLWLEVRNQRIHAWTTWQTVPLANR